MATVYCPSCAKRGEKVQIMKDLVFGWAIEQCPKCGAMIKASVDPRGHVESHVMTGKKAKIYSDD